MRLDHLLSKEQLDGEGRPVARAARLGGGVLVGGDTGEFSSATAGGLSTHRGDLVVERCCWCGWWEMVSTLLSPERTTVVFGPAGCCFGTVQAWPGLAYHLREPVTVPGFGVRLRVVGWLLVENCTVDASILFSVG